jgi:hypothetical protein
MKKLGLVLALMSSVSMTVLPVTPSWAATPSSGRATAGKQLQHTAAITQKQLDVLAKSRPSLYAKILAHKGGSPLVVTPAEARMLQAMNKQALASVSAGDPAALIVALLPAVLFLVTYVINSRGGAVDQGALSAGACIFENILLVLFFQPPVACVAPAPASKGGNIVVTPKP